MNPKIVSVQLKATVRENNGTERVETFTLTGSEMDLIIDGVYGLSIGDTTSDKLEQRKYYELFRDLSLGIWLCDPQ